MGKMTSSEEARALNPIDDLMFRKMAEEVAETDALIDVDDTSVDRNEPAGAFGDS